MKRKLLIMSIVIILILVFIFIYNYIEDTKIREVSNYTSNSFNIEQTDNAIIQTVHYATGYNPIKLITTYNLTSGRVSSITMAAHYETYAFAKDAINKKYENSIISRDGNIVNITLTKSYDLGKTPEEVIKQIELNNSITTIIEAD